MYRNRNRKLMAGIVAGIFVLSAFVMTGTAFGEAAGKVTICHRTFGTNPWLVLVVSENAWKDGNGGVHGAHPDDVFVANGDVADSVVVELHCVQDPDGDMMPH